MKATIPLPGRRRRRGLLLLERALGQGGSLTHRTSFAIGAPTVKA
ncbi:hypothetical protein WME97_15015 [Sorangium sp. So ce367]